MVEIESYPEMVRSVSFPNAKLFTDRLGSSSDVESSTIASFNSAFISAFRQTPAFELWDRTTDAELFDLVEPKYVNLFNLTSFLRWLTLIIHAGTRWRAKRIR
jgi:hypothetical protein